MVGIYRLPVSLFKLCKSCGLCPTATPRSGVSHGPLRITPLHNGHANWARRARYVTKRASVARHELPQYPAALRQVKARAQPPPQPLPHLRDYWVRLSIAEASLRTMSEKTASVSTSSITPVISNRTNPCMAAQNSRAA